jgi:hypothetical protein
MTPGPVPEKSHLSLTVPVSTKKRLVELRKSSGASSMTEVIRRSIAILELLILHRNAGGSVILRHEDGREENLHLM